MTLTARTTNGECVLLQLVGYGLQAGVILCAARRSGDGDRAAGAGSGRWRKAPGSARSDRFRKNVHDGESHGATEPADAGSCTQQNVSRAALSRISRLLSSERSRVLCQLLRLLPA